MDPITIVKSFAEGLGRDTPSDIVNGLYVSVKLMALDFPYEFHNGDPHGVSCREVRRILAFDLASDGTDRCALEAGKRLSRYESKILGLLAQYLYAKDKHLFPHEVEAAKGLLAEFPVSASP
jgi:hypothetical protein